VELGQAKPLILKPDVAAVKIAGLDQDAPVQ
jgi:hypothetical protein